MKENKTILMYHSVERLVVQEPGSQLYFLPYEIFKDQMEYLATRPATITFDDGDITNYEFVFPLLKALGLKAYFFPIISRIGTKGYMDWPQIIELKKAGMTIGSHGMTHRILTELNDFQIAHELVESKKTLEIELSEPVEYFSVPRGFYDVRVIECAKRAGYKGVFTSNPKDSDGFRIGRIPVKADWDINAFKRIFTFGLPGKEMRRQFIKGILKRTLGPKNYDKLRNFFLEQ